MYVYRALWAFVILKETAALSLSRVAVQIGYARSLYLDC